MRHGLISILLLGFMGAGTVACGQAPGGTLALSAGEVSTFEAGGPGVSATERDRVRRGLIEAARTKDVIRVAVRLDPARAGMIQFVALVQQRDPRAGLWPHFYSIRWEGTLDAATGLWRGRRLDAFPGEDAGPGPWAELFM